ncbi:hypothetical protein GCM10009827_084400 [Dactylosporangium maewongense]|uniref:Uncharacterized protein n=1 Tax=Dactylosporangium maewongense TaxID=634393 RepID=A0ABP4MVA9_9ACTN
MSDRILFPGNPWPAGHAVEELAWQGRLDPAGRLWFDLHVKSAGYYAEDPTYWDDDGDSGCDDWSSKVVWGNYHACTISSTRWGHRGFVAATDAEPLALDTLAGRTFHVDRDPDRPDGVPDGVADEDIEDEDAAFGIYLLGHDAVGDHRISFGARQGRTVFALDWHGRIALRYANSMAPFQYTFQATIGAVALDHIAAPSSLDDGAAEGLLRRVLVDAAMFELIGEGGTRRFVAR